MRLLEGVSSFLAPFLFRGRDYLSLSLTYLKNIVLLTTPSFPFYCLKGWLMFCTMKQEYTDKLSCTPHKPRPGVSGYGEWQGFPITFSRGLILLFFLYNFFLERMVGGRNIVIHNCTLQDAQTYIEFEKN